MIVKALVILIAIIAVSGFGTGLMLESMVEGETSKIQRLINGASAQYYGIQLIKSAEMSGTLQNIIDAASVSWIVQPMLMDPDGEPDTKDEFFENKIKVCKFHSDEDIDGSFFQNIDDYDDKKDNIDDGICIICKILSEDEDPCENIIANFIDLPDLSTQDDINTSLLAHGITVTGHAFGPGFPDDVLIFDSDIAHGTGDQDIESGGQCPGCLGFHLVILSDDANNDGLVDVPADDSGYGGIQTWKFDPPRYVKSFDFADKDSGPWGRAKAYSNSDCTGLIKSKLIQNVGNGVVQTITMDADNIRCLTIKYEDSGGVTNLDLRCVNDPTLKAMGQVNLPNGYTASDVVEIPLGDGTDLWVGSAQIEIKSAILDFAGFSENTVLNTQYLDDFGIEIMGKLNTGSRTSPVLKDMDLMVYDSDPGDGANEDPDLEVGVGNISIIPHDDNNDDIPDTPANDAPNGGKQIFKFHTERYVGSLMFVDADAAGSTNNVMGTVVAYDDFDMDGCTGNVIPDSTTNILSKGDGSTQVLVMMNIGPVSCLEVNYLDSGGVASINLGCPLQDDL